jgi:hypothetical protein
MNMRCEMLMALSIKNIVFYPKKMEAGFSETLSNFFQTRRHYNSEGNLRHSNEHLGLLEVGNFLIT